MSARSRCCFCADRAQNLPGPATNNVLTVPQISSKSVHFRRISRTREQWTPFKRTTKLQLLRRVIMPCNCLWDSVSHFSVFIFCCSSVAPPSFNHTRTGTVCLRLRFVSLHVDAPALWRNNYAAFHSSRELVFTRSRDPGNHQFTTCQWNALLSDVTINRHRDTEV